MLIIKGTEGEMRITLGYPLLPPPNELPQLIEVHLDAELSSAISDDKYIKVYAQVPFASTKQPNTQYKEYYQVLVVGTGVAFDAPGFKFLDTVRVKSGEVYHVYYSKCQLNNVTHKPILKKVRFLH